MRIIHLYNAFSNSHACMKCGLRKLFGIDQMFTSDEYIWQKPDQMFKHVHPRSKRPDTTDIINCQDPLAKIMEVHEI